jgi:3-dehydroquinate synthase
MTGQFATGQVAAQVHIPPMPARSAGYDVVIRAGVLDELAPHAAATGAARYVIIADDNVSRLFGEAARASLQQAGLVTDLVAFPAGEAHKTRETWQRLGDRMLALGCGRDSCIIALGGGVTGDLAGFVAATFMRGVPFLQVPTTLLAMIDASVGGKTGVDTAAGKNLIGAFHAPTVVLADPRVLNTLPSRELRSGLAEAIKHGAILDAEYLAWIEEAGPALRRGDEASLEHLVRRSVEIKAGVVAEDPLEHGRRAILNFGHTVGHALEQLSAYDIPHGFAVGIGMVVEASIGEVLGITAGDVRQQLARVLRLLELPAAPGAVLAPQLFQAMLLDKKARRARPRAVLLSATGSVAPTNDGGWTHEVSEDVLAEALHSTLSGSRFV